MYKVKIYNGSTETIIHSPHVNGLKLEKGVIKNEINKISSFDLSFFQNNPALGKMKPFKTLITAENIKTNEIIFDGRVLTQNEDMNNSGIVSYSYMCESELGYLHDSQQRHLEFRGTIKQAVETLINYHNTQVEPSKRFVIGSVDVTNSTNSLYFYLSAEKDTFDSLKEKLLDKLGGELQIRKVDGVRYIDYLKKVGSAKKTKIELSRNLSSISRDVDATEIITRLTPLGTRIKSEDETATDASEARLTIESINSGKPYIDRPDLIAEFGIQGGSITHDDITTVQALKSTAQKFMDEQKVVLNQYKLSAYDLSIIGLDIDNFKTGNTHKVVNPIMGIDEDLRIIGTTIDINEVQETNITIGDKFSSLYDYQADTKKANRSITELQNTIENQSKSLKLVRTELENVSVKYQEINAEIITLTNAVGSADLPQVNASILALQQSYNDLGDAISAIPVYLPADSTTDGLLTSALYRKLISIQLATNLVDGLLSKEDKAKLNLLTATTAVDLDQLRLDVNTLMGI